MHFRNQDIVSRSGWRCIVETYANNPVHAAWFYHYQIQIPRVTQYKYKSWRSIDSVIHRHWRMSSLPNKGFGARAAKTWSFMGDGKTCALKSKSRHHKVTLTDHTQHIYQVWPVNDISDSKFMMGIDWEIQIKVRRRHNRKDECHREDAKTRLSYSASFEIWTAQTVSGVFWDGYGSSKLKKVWSFRWDS